MGIANSILLDALAANFGAFSPSATTPFEGSEWKAQRACRGPTYDWGVQSAPVGCPNVLGTLGA